MPSDRERAIEQIVRRLEEVANYAHQHELYAARDLLMAATAAVEHGQQHSAQQAIWDWFGKLPHIYNPMMRSVKSRFPWAL